MDRNAPQIALDWLKRPASLLPLHLQQSLKRIYFARQIRSGSFITAEPEYGRLQEWIASGDWVIDVGANVGHYAIRMSHLVGGSGRVVAIEPVPDTFALLASNISVAHAQNVSMLNVAASDKVRLAGMSFPRFDTGLTNYYMAALTDRGAEVEVLAIPLDILMPPNRVSLIKIDVEGHELQALLGMQGLIRRDHPRLIVEGGPDAKKVAELLQTLGYAFVELKGSPNRVFERVSSSLR